MRIAVNNPHLILPKKNLNINLKFKVMKKVRKLCHSGTNRGFFNLFRVTKVVFMILLVGLVHVSATVVSQTVLNLKLKDVTLEEAVRGAEKQLKQDFFFNKQEIDVNRKVSVELVDGSLADFVRLVFGRNYSYEVVDNVIVISYKPVHQEQVKSVTITGMVMDKDSVPLPGVTVLIKGTSIGVVTDTAGRYKIALPEQKELSLIFSFIGMIAKEVKVTDQKEINVVLEENVENLEEVVITGYANVKKTSFTGSATTVTKDELKKVTSGNIISALQVFDPSLRMIKNNMMGSDPNTLPEFYIRGRSGMEGVKELDRMNATTDDVSRYALTNNPNTPIFIMDGYEVSVEKVYDLDLNRIESITILKDAAATAILRER